MTWRETNGPMVTVPERRGFGRQVLQQVAAQALAGKVMHKFLPEGVRWRLDIPAAAILSSCGVPASTPVGLEGRREVEGIGMSASEVNDARAAGSNHCPH